MLHFLLSFYVASVLTFLIFSFHLSVELFASVWNEPELAGAPLIAGVIGVLATALFLFLRFGLIPIINVIYIFNTMKDKESYIEDFKEYWRNREE